MYSQARFFRWIHYKRYSYLTLYGFQKKESKQISSVQGYRPYIPIDKSRIYLFLKIEVSKGFI